jgi:hypothetical protein
VEGDLAEDALRRAAEEATGALQGWADNACAALDYWDKLGAGTVLRPETIAELKGEVRRLALRLLGTIQGVCSELASRPRRG